MATVSREQIELYGRKVTVTRFVLPPKPGGRFAVETGITSAFSKVQSVKPEKGSLDWQL
jgi:hypothetical protein